MRAHINVGGIDEQWSADLMDMVKFAKYNQGYNYVLVVIDVFSKYLWLRSLKDKKGRSVALALEDIFSKGRQPLRIRTDRGQEFRAREVQNLLKQRNIRHLFAWSESKAAVSERILKTIKTRLYRYFTYRQSYEYVDKLQNFVDSYNHTKHRTIDMEPAQVNKNNSEDVLLATYFSHNQDTKFRKKWRFKFKVGDHVRIT